MPALDYVQVPPPQAYFEPINWHRTALHELGHATGHASRLGRDFSGSFGTRKYAFEELVAEMNAAFCCASLGIVPTVRHADYIGSWLEVLREDARPLADVDFDLLHPLVQSLGRTADVRGNRHDRLPTRPMRALIVENQPRRAFRHFGENLFVVLLMMLHPTQEWEPPANQARFNLLRE